MITLKDLQPVSEMPPLVQVPTFIQGLFKQTFIPEYEKARGKNNDFAFRGEDSSGIRRGSNVLNLGLGNKVLADSGARFRTPVPTDPIYDFLFPMIENQFYADLNAFDVWETKPSHEKNQEIWEQIIKLAKRRLGRAPEFPFRMQGFYCIPDETRESYGARIESATNFRIIDDEESRERLNLPTGTKFNSLDTNGMVEPVKNGRFTKYTLGNGVSGVCLYGGGDLVSGDGDLAVSVDGGRVVFIDA